MKKTRQIKNKDFEINSHDGIPSYLEEQPIYYQYIEEINNLTDEMNWRVKLAYTSNFTIISIILFTLGLFLNKEVHEIRGNERMYAYILLSMSIVISMYTSVVNANHLVEKRMELYFLKLQLLIFRETNVPLFCWLPFLYADQMFKSKILNFIQHITSGVYGFFQYLLPNLIAASFLLILPSFLGASNIPRLFYIIASFFCILSTLSTFVFFIFFFHLKSLQSSFYEEYFLPFYSSKTKT